MNAASTIHFSEEELRRIVERSSTLQERLDGGFVPNTTQVESSESSARWDEWRAIVVRDGGDSIGKRLEWDNVDLELARSLLGDVRLAGATAYRLGQPG